MTFEQGAITVIGTLSSVAAFMFWQMMSAIRARLSSTENDLSEAREELQECKTDREKIWEKLRDTPNPRFCPVKECPLREAVVKPLEVTFSAVSKPIKQDADTDPDHN